jgi:hypothetical protein
MNVSYVFPLGFSGTKNLPLVLPHFFEWNSLTGDHDVSAVHTKDREVCTQKSMLLSQKTAGREIQWAERGLFFDAKRRFAVDA